MSKVKFELNRAGVRELLRSEGALSVVLPYAESARNRAGDGYEVTTYVGRNRVNASVHAETYEARKDNYEHNTLLKSLGGGI
jgi:hypothetical protein